MSQGVENTFWQDMVCFFTLYSVMGLDAPIYPRRMLPCIPIKREL